MIRAVSSLVVLLVILGACSSAPTPVRTGEEWTLEPTSADQKLYRDDQFLQKAQQPVEETAGLRNRRRPFLKP